MRRIFFFSYLLCLALWVGGMAGFAFLVTPQLFLQLDRDQAAHIVGFLFPLYYPLMVGISLAGVVSFWASHPKGSKSYKIVSSLLVLAVGINLYQWLVLFPQTAQLAQEIGSFLNTPKDNPLRQAFTRLHIQANLLGLVVFVDGLLLLVFAYKKE